MRFAETVINVDRRMSYNQVADILKEESSDTGAVHAESAGKGGDYGEDCTHDPADETVVGYSP